MDEMNKLCEALPDSKAENEISNALRQASSEERGAAVFSILSAADPGVRLAGLRIAKRVIREEPVAEKILALGLDRGDAYEIRFWLQCASAIMGAKKTLNVIAEYASQSPGRVVRSWHEIHALAKSDANHRAKIR